jgi:hypothetical protein
MDSVVELWKPIELFPDYSVSSWGRIRSNKRGEEGKILALSPNQYGVMQVGLMRDQIQHHRSVPLLVAKAFLPPFQNKRQDRRAFDTPINLDGNRRNNLVTNLAWRPRWYAVKYNRQFRYPYEHPIYQPIIDLDTGEVSKNSLECAKRYGLLEQEIVLSILNRTYTWPTYQYFSVVVN